jgi:hypothetical protein
MLTLQNTPAYCNAILLTLVKSSLEEIPGTYVIKLFTAVKVVHSYRLPASLANLLLGWKGLSERKTLGYYENLNYGSKIFYRIGPR